MARRIDIPDKATASEVAIGHMQSQRKPISDMKIREIPEKNEWAVIAQLTDGNEVLIVLNKFDRTQCTTTSRLGMNSSFGSYDYLKHFQAKTD
jgi:hypothetical protein